MGQRDFNVDERVHYIKNICCLNSLNWTIFSQFIAFWFYFFYKGKNYNSSSRFQAHGLLNALRIWKTRFRNNMNMIIIIINLVVNIWPNWDDLCLFFFILKRDFFLGGGGSRTDESWSSIRSLFTPCSLVSKSPEVNHMPWWMTLDVVIMNRKFSQNLSHSVIWCKFWYCPYPVTLFFHEQRMICGKRVLRSR